MENSLPDIKLSICIPTYNRAQFIGETIQSVISQAGNNVEIIIVDGASTDNTADVVQSLTKEFREFRNLVYYRGEKNMGVDRDMAKTIELSRGEYCWLLSDDDWLKPGAINRILKEIESEYEIYLCNVTACSLFMQPIKERFWLSREVKDRIFHLHNKNELIEYCNKANSIGAFFSYMSSIVLRREEWNKTGYNYDFDGTAYALASSLLSFISRSCRLKYIRDRLVLWRNDNESFQNEGGLVKRFLLDFDGYLQLADKYLAENQNVRDAFLKVMIREHPWYTIINVTSFIDSPEVWRQFRGKLLKFGYNPRVVAICYTLGRFKYLVSVAVTMKRKIVKSRRIHKVAELLYRK
ncbi:MAG: glycosyltransferase [Proteobacteria bacterium]|nr:glycosyltransferase [Pseudomonadota bacterium]